MSDEEKKEKKTKKKKNVKRSPVKIAFSVAAAAVVVFFLCCQLYIAGTKSSVSTQIALYDEYVKSVNAQMFIVRDEELISFSGSNIVSAVADGARVGAADTVAYSFADSSSAAAVVRMAEISELLDYYTALSARSAVVTGDTSAYDNRIIDDVAAFAGLVSSGNLTSLGSSENELRDAITSKQTATGVKLDLTGTISALQSEYASLSSGSSRYSEIKSGGTGYYISGSDGLENALAFDEVENWSVADVENAVSAVPGEVSPSAVGRVVHSYNWYLVCTVKTEDIANLRTGRRLTIEFPESSAEDIVATVFRISPEKASGKSVVVFRCREMNEDLASLRCELADIHIEEVAGYRIDNSAIYTNEDGEKGVYVVEGSIMRFRKIQLEYSSEDYSIVSNPGKGDASKSGQYLSLYDEYITNGTDLYDGKLIK